MKPYLLFLFLAVAAGLPASPLYSSTWGFFLDLPEGYELVEGNGNDRFSFEGPGGVMFDIAVYGGVYPNVGQMADDVNRRLENAGDSAFFEYGGKGAVLIELDFGDFAGWGLCLELSGEAGAGAPLLLALSYMPKDGADRNLYILSALDSLAPAEKDRRCPGPIMEFGYPRGEQREFVIAGTPVSAMIREHDAEAAQALVDREFALLYHYQFTPDWQEAWIRFYRMIYRDSYDRIANAAFRLARSWNDRTDERAFAGRVLSWVQGFNYERNLDGSDFVNLVSALAEGRGDCDSRSMLWAMVLRQANIPAAIMVSRSYSHAMGLADIGGSGARFLAGEVDWLVAETTVNIDIGLINQEMSDRDNWLGVLFD